LIESSKRTQSKEKKCIVNKTGIKDFESFYNVLFSNEDIEENDDLQRINEIVNSYYNTIKDAKYDLSEFLIDRCLKKLKNNKAVGDDNICNEMLKNAKCV
jgi:hypothetical protein